MARLDTLVATLPWRLWMGMALRRPPTLTSPVPRSESKLSKPPSVRSRGPWSEGNSPAGVLREPLFWGLLRLY